MNETTIVRAIKNDKPKTFYKLYGWREREGIEPPRKTVNRPPIGFEVRRRHQVAILSKCGNYSEIKFI